MDAPRIETDRLVLRALGADDFPVYERFYADAEASAGYGGPMNSGAAWRRLAIDLGHWRLRGFGMRAVEVKGSG